MRERETDVSEWRETDTEKERERDRRGRERMSERDSKTD
jgi:hypothetical protein